jgi:LysR family glycine cleavage system transcriptional activator
VASLRRRGLLTVSCSPSFAIRWLVPRLPELSQELPGVDVRVAADDRLVRPGQNGVDVCVRFGTGPYNGGVHAQRLTQERWTPVCNPSMLERLPLSTPAGLEHATLLHDEAHADTPGRVGWGEWLEAAGLDPRWADRGPRFSHAHMALDAALAGQGIALGRPTLVERDLAAGRLVAPFPDRVTPSNLSYWLITDPSAQARPCVRAFGAWLDTHLAHSAALPSGM